ncbi:hypothetical protein GCM10009675_40370 [Prauserella alba]|uniref:YbaB/EbfC DNA-binding family protein n=1 Tax=Prauserella alba TaxID=176898 RepID=A0ABN1VK34_9PSEU
MKRRKLLNSVLAVLERAGWRASDTWTVRCHNEQGRTVTLQVGVALDGITITPSSSGRLTLTTAETGQLRAALRDALSARAPLVPEGAPLPRRSNTFDQAHPRALDDAPPRVRRYLATPSRTEGTTFPGTASDPPRWPGSDPARTFIRAA